MVYADYGLVESDAMPSGIGRGTLYAKPREHLTGTGWMGHQMRVSNKRVNAAEVSLGL